jgi:hypothetical protein
VSPFYCNHVETVKNINTVLYLILFLFLETSTVLNARTNRAAPPIPQKSAGLIQKIMTSSSPDTCFQRTGSDRTPHRPAPPVPMPGLVPVRRSMPRPSPPARHLSAPAGIKQMILFIYYINYIDLIIIILYSTYL